MDLLRFFRPRPAKDKPGAVTDPRVLRGENEAIASAVAAFLTQTRLFDRDEYLRTYPDVAKSGLDPLHHFALVGVQAGRKFTSEQTIARLWREVLENAPTVVSPAPMTDPARYRAAIYVSSLGNFFMTEIAEVLKAGFDDLGVRAELCDEKAEPRDATHHIVVAPHEFFFLGEGRRWANDAFVSRAIMVATEQLQTAWFARSLVFLLRAKAVADMNEQSAAILRKAGVRAVSVQPGFSAAFKPLATPASGATLAALAPLPDNVRAFDIAAPRLADRPLDLLFLGSHSARRERLLATYADKFADLQTFIHRRHMDRPLQPAADPMAATAVTAALLQRSKLLLNLHRDDYTYFEWWRLMQAFWLKTVVVTEPCFPHSIYKPGIHYFEEAPDRIPGLVEWLVRTKDGQAKAEEVRARAHRDFMAHSTAKVAAMALLAIGLET
ncbi:MAG: hypothetical protein KBA31_20320 [Alphaproteobacteria bacterium]|nr:hypothetical protein [Alphaproteobacteria bacterium]